MDRLGLDADGDARAGGGQRAARRLADEQLQAVVAGEPELERGAEIDRLHHLAGEASWRRGRAKRSGRISTPTRVPTGALPLAPSACGRRPA